MIGLKNEADVFFEKVQLLMGEQSGERRITVEIIVDPEDLELFIDEKQITQVLVNLGKNAQQALENQGDGVITFAAGIDDAGKKVVQVRDNGPGISPDNLEEIFVPFFTTKNTGTGIGLSLSKQIMRLHGGSIRVASGEQTVFTLTFE